MQFLAPLIFNKFFISEFIKADHSSAAIGILEEFGIQRGFIAIKPESLIPDKFTRNGINFGHQLLGDNHNTKSTMIRFTIKIYNYKDEAQKKSHTVSYNRFSFISLISS